MSQRGSSVNVQGVALAGALAATGRLSGNRYHQVN
jgi:hypothetical protein